MATIDYYPPVGFHFRVELIGLRGVSERDNLFQEVSGLSVEITTEEVKSGGENRFAYKLPTRAQYPNLTLKRGLLVDSAVIAYLKDSLENLEITPITLQISLLNELSEPLQTYQCFNAYPVKWSVDSFNASESKVVVESMEWYYQYLKIQ